MSVRLIHLKNPIAVTLPDGSDIATECIRKEADGTFAVRVDRFSETGEWITMPKHWSLRIPNAEIANVEQIGYDPPPPPVVYGESDERPPRV